MSDDRHDYWLSGECGYTRDAYVVTEGFLSGEESEPILLPQEMPHGYEGSLDLDWILHQAGILTGEECYLMGGEWHPIEGAVCCSCRQPYDMENKNPCACGSYGICAPWF